MGQCPQCEASIDSGFGILNCPKCNILLIVDLDGTVQIAGGSDEVPEPALPLPPDMARPVKTPQEFSEQDYQEKKSLSVIFD